MSLVVAWTSADDKPEGKSLSAIYFGADSQYTEYSDQHVVLNKRRQEKKVWAVKNYPDIFALFGDVYYPRKIMDLLVESIETGGLYHPDELASEKMNLVSNRIKVLLKGVSCEAFNILFATRDECGFSLCEYVFDGFLLKREIHPLPPSSSVVLAKGSGEKDFNKRWVYDYSSRTNEFGTCRAVYHCLAKTIQETTQEAVGGAPQLVGLYRGGNSRAFGILKGDKTYLYGVETGPDDITTSIEWRNDSFERIDPYRLKLLDGAKAQPFAMDL